MQACVIALKRIQERSVTPFQLRTLEKVFGASSP